MNVWFLENINLTGPLVYDNQDKNVIILGKIHSDSDISFRVKNLVILGEIITTKSLTVNAKADILNYGYGLIRGETVNIVSAGNLSNNSGITDTLIEKIRALGIHVMRTSRGLAIAIAKIDHIYAMEFQE